MRSQRQFKKVNIELDSLFDSQDKKEDAHQIHDKTESKFELESHNTPKTARNYDQNVYQGMKSIRLMILYSYGFQ